MHYIVGEFAIVLITTFELNQAISMFQTRAIVARVCVGWAGVFAFPMLKVRLKNKKSMPIVKKKQRIMS